MLESWHFTYLSVNLDAGDAAYAFGWATSWWRFQSDDLAKMRSCLLAQPAFIADVRCGWAAALKSWTVKRYGCHWRLQPRTFKPNLTLNWRSLHFVQSKIHLHRNFLVQFFSGVTCSPTKTPERHFPHTKCQHRNKIKIRFPDFLLLNGTC